MTGKQAGREIPITASRFLIGGAESCDLKIHAIEVSPFHCALVIQDDGMWVCDYGSGIIVDGMRIVGRRRLNHGDQLQIGPLHFELLIEEELLIEDAPVKGNGRVADDGEILDIVSRGVEHPVAPVPELNDAVKGRSESSTTPAGAHTALAKQPEPADTAYAASDIPNELYTPKISLKATVGAKKTLAQKTLAKETPAAATPVSAPMRLVIALPRWMFATDWQLNPYVMFALGVWAGIGIFSAAVALFRIVNR